MNLKIYKPAGIAVIAAAVLCGIHLLVFQLGSISSQNYQYTIGTLYTIFTLFSVFIISILIHIGRKSIDNVGYTFLLITSVKMVAAYFLLRPILASDSDSAKFEKFNFFIIFLLFLAIETIISIRILNNKQ